ncbi:MAG: crossover junction endodeoxyribonuclease RuvC [Candidatus Harrisonbacteria bacterium CG10_big_fil_rev_8_21_14_0_10_49_15]|uniref:Crossover junction endodeoxyribonuclease RuvC n=1 Tax=Candidatus Harrisonbacteria bacterium CG10_big_fil_rev_8_21_14_0_10_49_15 TaxID=1974587 RepID=A0A2H0UKC5_9BACT|nr:MAG: crossover junction endodeoxyribonuclease RuvC [Candidatus Harrisonbacteria bacterium CG10_big_fil_rev_8_21_14_0_10_49_15]
MKILGIDPGSALMGYGVIKENTDGSLSEQAHGVLVIKAKTIPDKLNLLAHDLRELLKKHQPDIAGVETLFFSKNKKTAFEVAHARGVILLLLLEHNIPIYEYTPGQIKSAVTGYGNADKEMVAKMVRHLLSVKLKGDDNASDALAVAITTAHHTRLARKSSN